MFCSLNYLDLHFSATPYFSPVIEVIASLFGFTKSFMREWNNLRSLIVGASPVGARLMDTKINN